MWRGAVRCHRGGQGLGFWAMVVDERRLFPFVFLERHLKTGTRRLLRDLRHLSARDYDAWIGVPGRCERRRSFSLRDCRRYQLGRAVLSQLEGITTCSAWTYFYEASISLSNMRSKSSMAWHHHATKSTKSHSRNGLATRSEQLVIPRLASWQRRNNNNIALHHLSERSKMSSHERLFTVIVNGTTAGCPTTPPLSYSVLCPSLRG